MLAYSELSRLRPGRTLEGRIGGERVRTYSFPASRDDFIEVSVEQRGIDLTVSLLDSRGQLLATVTALSSGDGGTETLPALLDASGTYQIQITATDRHDDPGEYALRLGWRKPSQADRYRALAVREMTRPDLEKAAAYAEKAGDGHLLTEILYRQGYAHLRTSDNEAARRAFARAGEEYRAHGNLLGEAHAWDLQGHALWRLNDLHGSLDARRKALDLYEKVGGRQGDWGQATVYFHIASTHAILGNYGLAKLFHEKALEIWPPNIGKLGQIDNVYQLGVLYLDLVQPEPALQQFEKALNVVRRLKQDENLACREALVLSGLGGAYTYKRDDSKAHYYFQRAFGLSSLCKDAETFARAANQSGSIYFYRPAKLMNRYVAGLFYRQALKYAKHPGSRANALGGLAGLALRDGNREEAARLFDKALAVRLEQKFLLGIAGALFGRAQAKVAMGNLEEGQAAIRESLAEIERLRLGPQGDTLNASLLASRRLHFDLSVTTYMAQHQHDSGAGFAARAFEVNETARARVLLDWLGGDWGTEDEGPVVSGPEKVISERLQDLKRELGQLEASLDEDSTEEEYSQVQALEGEIRELVLKRQDLQAESRTLNLENSEPLTLQEIQEQVLDDRTLLLSYWFGAEGQGSYLWAVDRTSIVPYSFSADEVEQIQRLARQVHQDISSDKEEKEEGSARRELLNLDRLSRLVLPEPIASRLEGRRLMIVADGELQLIPFEVLQEPGFPLPVSGPDWAGYEPLIERHAVLSLPSASMLGLLRSELAGRQPPSKDLAVIADPIFNARDDRVSGSGDRSEARSAVLDSLLQSQRRLKYSGEEAEAILAFVEPEKSFRATGFEANVDTVLTTPLAQYKFVHFATHGFADPTFPDLAGLAFSGVQPDLSPRRGFLRAFEISSMDLPVELVVLSACETGIGQNVPGEGVFNLSRAFFYAGARRVVVTLWNVDDEATSVFMKFFYEGLLQDQLEPSEALQAAQNRMRRIQRWRHPMYWGGFVLQGEW